MSENGEGVNISRRKFLKVAGGAILAGGGFAAGATGLAQNAVQEVAKKIVELDNKDYNTSSAGSASDEASQQLQKRNANDAAKIEDTKQNQFQSDALRKKLGQ